MNKINEVDLEVEFLEKKKILCPPLNESYHHILTKTTRHITLIIILYIYYDR